MKKTKGLNMQVKFLCVYLVNSKSNHKYSATLPCIGPSLILILHLFRLQHLLLNIVQ